MKTFEEPIVSVVYLDSSDIICASSDACYDPTTGTTKESEI